MQSSPGVGDALLIDARNFLRLNLEVRTVGELLDAVRPSPTELAAVHFLQDLVDRRLLLREHSTRQAFTLLVLKGPSLLSPRTPA